MVPARPFCLQPPQNEVAEDHFLAPPRAWSSNNKHAKAEPNYPKVSQGSFLQQTTPAMQEGKS